MRIAFNDIDNFGWTAGAHYYTNLFRALHDLPADRRPEIVVADREGGAIGGYDTYRAYNHDDNPANNSDRADHADRANNSHRADHADSPADSNRRHGRTLA
ncbi:MAG: hypothetical protein WCK06_04985 [Actinomycetota bacterium]